MNNPGGTWRRAGRIAARIALGAMAIPIVIVLAVPGMLVVGAYLAGASLLGDFDREEDCW